MRGLGLVPALLPLLGLSPSLAMALEVYVAPLVVIDETGSEALRALRPEADLLRALARGTTGDSLSVLRSREDPAETPRSLLDAALLCERQGYAFLLYGYVKRTAVALSAELKLLDHERGQIAAAFFGGDDPAHYERLMREMAAKVLEYFVTTAGLRPPARAEDPRRNLVELATWLGYWTPMGGDWDRVVAGIATVGLAARLIPAYPLFKLWSRSAYVALGLEGEYGLGMNEPGYESFFLHLAKLRVPVEVVLELPAGHAVGLGAGLLVELDTAVQDRKYSSLFTDTTVVPGFCLTLLYRYSPSGRISLGVESVLEVAAYSPPLLVFSPRLSVSFRKGDPHE